MAQAAAHPFDPISRGALTSSKVTPLVLVWPDHPGHVAGWEIIDVFADCPGARESTAQRIQSGEQQAGSSREKQTILLWALTQPPLLRPWTCQRSYSDIHRPNQRMWCASSYIDTPHCLFDQWACGCYKKPLHCGDACGGTLGNRPIPLTAPQTPLQPPTYTPQHSSHSLMTSLVTSRGMWEAIRAREEEGGGGGWGGGGGGGSQQRPYQTFPLWERTE